MDKIDLIERVKEIEKNFKVLYKNNQELRKMVKDLYDRLYTITRKKKVESDKPKKYPYHR